MPAWDGRKSYRVNGTVTYRAKHHDRVRAAFFVFVFLLASYSSAFADADASYYVANNGSDANPGTIAQPFRTLQKAVRLLKPGQTLIVRAGEYDTVNGLTVAGGKSLIPSGESWEKPVTIKAYPGEKVTFRRYMPAGSAVTERDLQTTRAARLPTEGECAAAAKAADRPLSFPWDCFTATGGGIPPWQVQPTIDPATLPGYVLDLAGYANGTFQYVIFDGIDFDARGIVRGLIGTTKGAQHLRFQNLEIRNAIFSCVSNLVDDADRGVQADHQWINVKVHHCGVPYDTNMIGKVMARDHPAARFFQSFYYHTGGVTWDRVEVYKIAGTALSPLGKNNFIRNSYFHDYNAQGIIIYGYPFPDANWQITNNIFVGDRPIQVESLSDYKVSHNTMIAGPDPTGVQNSNAVLLQPNVNGGTLLLQDNIIYGYKSGIVNTQTAGNTVATFKNNLIKVLTPGKEIVPGANRMNQSGNILNVDPMLNTGDFTLKPGSPAIGKATDGGNIGAK